MKKVRGSNLLTFSVLVLSIIVVVIFSTTILAQQNPKIPIASTPLGQNLGFQVYDSEGNQVGRLIKIEEENEVHVSVDLEDTWGDLRQVMLRIYKPIEGDPVVSGTSNDTLLYDDIFYFGTIAFCTGQAYSDVITSSFPGLTEAPVLTTYGFFGGVSVWAPMGPPEPNSSILYSDYGFGQCAPAYSPSQVVPMEYIGDFFEQYPPPYDVR